MRPGSETGGAVWPVWCITLCIIAIHSGTGMRGRARPLGKERRRAKWVEQHQGQATVLKGGDPIPLTGLHVPLGVFNEHRKPGTGPEPKDFSCTGLGQSHSFSLPSDYNSPAYEQHNEAVYARPEFNKLRQRAGRVIHLFSQHGLRAAAELQGGWGRNGKGERTLANKHGRRLPTWGMQYSQGLDLGSPASGNTPVCFSVPGPKSGRSARDACTPSKALHPSGGRTGTRANPPPPPMPQPGTYNHQQLAPCTPAREHTGRRRTFSRSTKGSGRRIMTSTNGLMNS